LVNAALAALSADFDALYSRGPAEHCPEAAVARASAALLLLGGSERQLMERLKFDLLFRWCVGLGWTRRYGRRASSRDPGAGQVVARRASRRRSGPPARNADLDHR
jgi:hypothetical protein